LKSVEQRSGKTRVAPGLRKRGKTAKRLCGARKTCREIANDFSWGKTSERKISDGYSGG